MYECKELCVLRVEMLQSIGQVTQLGHQKRSFLSKSIAINPYSDKKRSVFVQIYIKRPTFGQKHLFIKKNALPLPHISVVLSWIQQKNLSDVHENVRN